jgi:hypothetical protein
MTVLRAEGHGFAGPLRKVAVIRTGASGTADIWWGFKAICMVPTPSWREALISTSPAPTGSSNPPMRRVRSPCGLRLASRVSALSSASRPPTTTAAAHKLSKEVTAL